jgi:hypothetical protein
MPDPTVRRHEPDAPPVAFAFWDDTATKIRIIYSLPLFHEIEFFVNEGYRKIPHGGIEVGGLFFGSISVNETRLEAFRSIECEHAAGPSFNLSDRDLAALEQQIKDAPADPELARLKPVGWFLAHARSPLEMTETEVRHFERFFPQPGHVTVLVKPERFQPTRFGFVVRQKDRALMRDPSGAAIILPLPGRSLKAEGLIPSLPAPNTTATGSPSPDANQATATPESPKPSTPVADESSKEPAAPAPLQTPKPPPPVAPPAEEPAHAYRSQMARDRMRAIEEAMLDLESAETGSRAPSATPPPPAPKPPTPTAPPPPPFAPPIYSPPIRDVEERPLQRPPKWRSLTILAVAALLGCLAGYIGYLQLPPPVIPLEVKAQNQTIVVSWPPSQTRNAVYAAIRLNDDPPVPLSNEEKTAGQVMLTATRDFKIEVIARNWMRDSRGIVRYVHAPPGAASQP